MARVENALFLNESLPMMFIRGVLLHHLQAETRKIYQTLLDEEDNFTGFDIGLKYVFMNK